MGPWCAMNFFFIQTFFQFILLKWKSYIPDIFYYWFFFLSIYVRVPPGFFNVFVRVPCLTSFYFKNDKKKKNKGVQSTGRNWKIWLLSDVRNSIPSTLCNKQSMRVYNEISCIFSTKGHYIVSLWISLQKSAVN